MADELKQGERIAILETVTKGHGEALTKKVDRHEFHPVQRIVYGVVGLILTAFAAALVKIVFLSSKLPVGSP